MDGDGNRDRDGHGSKDRRGGDRAGMEAVMRDWRQGWG